MDSFNATQKDEAKRKCSGDVFCAYDFLATENEAVANNTKIITDTVQKEGQEAANRPPQVSGQLVVNATAGQNVTLAARATDADNDDVTIFMEGSIVSSSRGQGGASIEYVWQPGNTTAELRFYARDNNSAVSSVLTVGIVLCSGCSNHGSCDFENPQSTDTRTFFTAPCICNTGWDGGNCDVDFDGCHDSPCDPPYKCYDNTPSIHQNTSEAYKCEGCPAGYRFGDYQKCVDIDECSNTTNSCAGNQTCKNTEGSYECSCPKGFRKQDVSCLDIDECYELTSGCQQICVNNMGSFTCSCRDGYNLDSDGKTCKIAVQPALCPTFGCSQGCSEASGSAQCFCYQGYKLDSDGKKCSDIDECADQNGKKCPHICRNTQGGYQCSCYKGFQLQSDQKSCQACDEIHWGINCNQSCDCTQNSLGCNPTSGCMCKTGWTGTYCQSNINECLTQKCGALEDCLDTEGSYVCQCKSGYRRNSTLGVCQNINECSKALHNCSALEDCTDTPGGFQCSCINGYQKYSNGSCQDVDECMLKTDHCTHHCVNTKGSYNCRCNIGFVLLDDRRTCNKSSDPCSGLVHDCDDSNGGCFLNATDHPVCFCNKGYKFDEASKRCDDIDECKQNIHGCSAGCKNNNGGFQCTCPTGSKLKSDQKTCQNCSETQTWGTNCENRCNCGIGATTCDPLLGCVCSRGWTGTLCTVNYDECSNTSTNLCQENSECIDLEPSFVCHCLPGFTKSNNYGPCQDVDECQNNENDCTQRCHNTVGSFQCACNDGFQLNADNKTCTNINECQIGSSDCEQICVDTEGSYFCQCNSGFTLDSNLQTCSKDSTVDPCNITGIANDCSYGCRVVGGRAECYCDADSRLDLNNNKTCIAFQNKISANLTTDFPYTSSLKNPPSSDFKTAKKDFEDSLEDVFRHIPGFKAVVVTGFRTDAVQPDSTQVEFSIILADDQTQQDVVNASQALLDLRPRGILVGVTKYNILSEPRIGTSQDPVSCVICPQSCYIISSTTYQCRSPADGDRSLIVQMSLDVKYESYFNDSRDIRFRAYSEEIVNGVKTIISSYNVEHIQVDYFRELADSKTQIYLSLLTNISVTEPVIRTIATDLYQQVDEGNCLRVSGSCVQLDGQTFIGNTSSNLVAVVCYTCTSQQTCVLVSGNYQCLTTPPTTTSSPPSETSNIDLILGLGLGIPLGIILLIIIIALILRLCCHYGYWREDSSSESEEVDPWRIREAFGTFNSKLSGHKEFDLGAPGGGMFGGVPYIQQGRDIVASQRQYDPDAPYDYRTPFYGAADDSLHFGPGASNFDFSHDEDYQPTSTFSWDFLFNTLDPKEEFKIQRPAFDQEPGPAYQDDIDSQA